jgi:hypothetical protein
MADAKSCNPSAAFTSATELEDGVFVEMADVKVGVPSAAVSSATELEDGVFVEMADIKVGVPSAVLSAAELNQTEDAIVVEGRRRSVELLIIQC